MSKEMIRIYDTKEIPVEKLVQYYEGTNNPFLPLKVQLLWFRKIFPNGKIRTTQPEAAPGKEVNTFVSTAYVYKDVNDSLDDYLACASCKRTTADGDDFDGYESAQSAAISNALELAGFMAPVTVDELKAPVKEGVNEPPMNNGETQQEDTTKKKRTTKSKEEVQKKVQEEPAVETEDGSGVVEKNTGTDVPKTVPENRPNEPKKAVEVSREEDVTKSVSGEPVITNDGSEKKEASTPVPFVEKTTTIEVDVNADEDIPMPVNTDATDAAKKDEDAKPEAKFREDETAEQKTADELKEDISEKEAGLSDTQKAELEEARGIHIMYQRYDCYFGELEKRIDDEIKSGEYDSRDFMNWLSVSKVVKKKYPSWEEAAKKILAIHPEWQE